MDFNTLVTRETKNNTNGIGLFIALNNSFDGTNTEVLVFGSDATCIADTTVATCELLSIKEALSKATIL